MAGQEQLNPSLFVLVDALGWEILRHRPFLDDVLTERARVETIFGYSSGAIPSLLTGQYPAHHGHWNLFYRSPETSPFRWTRPLLALPPSLREHRVTRRVVKEISRRVSGYTGYFAIYNLPLDRIQHFDICETSDIYEPGGLSPARSLFDILSEAAIPYECFNYHQATDEEILRRVPERLKISESRVFFVYLSGFDSFLHFNVLDEKAVDEKLAWYEAGIRRLYQEAVDRWGEVRFRVFSDHGMTPIRETRDLIRDLEGLGLQVPQEYLAAFDSTMARFWCADEGSASRLTDFLSSLPYGRVLTTSELHELGLDFSNDRYGQVVFAMKPGVLICPSDMGRIRFAGMHGFLPGEDPHAAAAFLSNGPDGRQVRHITHVLPRLMEDLGRPGLSGGASAAGDTA
jgi:predicted AlkP superfamily pyrophosphatase or phosphodiesterase